MVKCDAPSCDNLVAPNKNNTVQVTGNWGLFGMFKKKEHYCDVCNERRTSGRISDNNPNTNSDLG